MMKRWGILLLCALISLLCLTGCEHQHTWEEATCTEPKTCSACGETEGEAKGHTVEQWSVVKEATCAEEGSESGACSVCGEIVERNIAKLEHTPGEWEVTKEATEDTPGEKTQHCAVCGTEMAKESFTLTPEEIKANYVSKCEAYDYETIARDPDQYLLTNACYTGEVIQVLENGDEYQLRVNITETRYGYTDTIYVTYNRREGEARILEDDIVTIYGVNMSTVSYKSVLGATVTLPCVMAMYVDVL